MRKTLGILCILILIGIIGAFYWTTLNENSIVREVATTLKFASTHINKSGLTINNRIQAPDGYQKTVSDSGTFDDYIINYTLKSYDAQVINYDGNPYIYQSGHVGVLDIPVPDNGLQQCADALIRIRAEYLWDQNRKDEIGFKFTSGHYCSWSKYAQGYRPKINGNKVSFSKTTQPDTSKANLYRYLNLIFTYSGTQSLFDELPKIKTEADLQIGDMLIYPGFPGHVMMIVAIAENPQGDRLFAFAQGNTPAQSVHIIKNIDSGLSPWYIIDFDNRVNFETPIYTFSKFDFIRFK